VAEISLAVTKAALDYAQGRENERQISFSAPSPEIAAVLAAATAQQRVLLQLGGRINLVVGDTSAVWLAHNSAHADDFTNLYTFLAKYPSQAIRFVCEVVT
jgi:hypothetical protein